MVVKNINDLIKEFTNEVMCRRESNQIKANKIWLDLKLHLNKQDITLFEIEWKGHYLGTRELTPNSFSSIIDDIINPYLK